MRYILLALFLFALKAEASPVSPLKVPNPAFALAQNGEWVQGNPEAKVTVTEYASFSCSHCATFHQTVFPVIFKKYIATNKIKFIYRDFPLNAPALRASMIVRCMAEDKRAEMITALYKNQNKWAFNKDFEINLKALAIDQGMSKKEFKKCMADKAIEESVVKSRMDATKELNVSGTPSVYINGERYEGAPNADDLAATIDKYLAASRP